MFFIRWPRFCCECDRWGKWWWVSRVKLNCSSSQRTAPVPQCLYSLGILHCGDQLWSSSGEEAMFRGPAAFQNQAAKYPASVRESGLGSRTCSLSNDLLRCRLPDNQIVPREWFLYSPSTGSDYCYACVGPCALMHMSQTKRPREACSWSQKPNY